MKLIVFMKYSKSSYMKYSIIAYLEVNVTWLPDWYRYQNSWGWWPMASYHTQMPWSWNIILWQLTHVSGHHRKELQSLESLELLLWWVSTQRYFVDCNLCTLCEDMFCGMSKLYKQQLNALWRNCLMWAMCLLTHKKFIRRQLRFCLM